MILTDSSEHAETFAVPVAAAQQWGVSELFAPLTMAEIPVLVGDAKPQGLVNTAAVTVWPCVRVLVRIFNGDPRNDSIGGDHHVVSGELGRGCPQAHPVIVADGLV